MTYDVFNTGASILEDLSKDSVRHILNSFIVESGERFETVFEHLQRKDGIGARKVIHMLRGSVPTFSQKRFGEVLAETSTILRDNEIEEAATHWLSTVLPMWAKLYTEIIAWLDVSSSPMLKGYRSSSSRSPNEDVQALHDRTVEGRTIIVPPLAANQRFD